MEKVWQKIDNWLRANASEIASDLLTGATQEEFAEVEKHIQIQFTQDFKQSYLIHNGQQGYADPLMGEWKILSLKHIRSEWDIMKKLYDESVFSDAISEPIGEIKSDWWNPKWIPIASNGSGDLICLDLDPDIGGNIGQVISFWHMDERREKLADNFQIWLQKFADDLESGQYKVKKSGQIVKIKS